MKFILTQNRGELEYDRETKILDDCYVPSIGTRSSSRLTQINDEAYQFGEEVVEAMNRLEKGGATELNVECPLYKKVRVKQKTPA